MKMKSGNPESHYRAELVRMPEKSYFKETTKSNLIIAWIPFLAIATLACICIYIGLHLIFHILLEDSFLIGEYLMRRSLFADLAWPSIVAFLISFSGGIRFYRAIREKPFVSLSEERFILNFGENSFLWDQIQKIVVEDNRKLEVIYEEKGERKEKAVDLRWFPKRENFIVDLKDNCTKRDIPFHEDELTFFSKIELKGGWMHFTIKEIDYLWIFLLAAIAAILTTS